MRNPLRSTFLVTASALALPPLAYAHPGHEGHELTWDFSHLAAHPIATAGCLLAAGAGAWLVWRLTRRTATIAQVRRSTR